MATVQTPAPSRALGMAAVAFGVLGLGFFWWVPFGLVLGLAGLLLGIVGLIMGSRRQTGLRLLAAGTLLSVCAQLPSTSFHVS